MNRFPILNKMTAISSKEEGAKSPVKVSFRFFLDSRGKLHYQKVKIIDLRWNHRKWQRGCESQVFTLLNSPGRNVFIHVEKMARRHGKTFSSIHKGINALPAIPHPNPVMAYYCPEKSQAIRNAWAAIESATRNIPNIRLDKAAGTVTFPRPTLSLLKDYCTIYLLPLARGMGAKKGQHYDICVVDECDQALIEFIKEVCIISCSDRGGILELKGTPDGNDRLNSWLDTAKKKCEFKEAFNRGEVSDIPDEMVDFNNWSFFESDAEKEDVYTAQELKNLKAVLGDVIYNNQMLCKDVVSNEKYYYRNVMVKVESEKRASVILKPAEKVPLRIYYDVGIGKKSDRMAFVIAQHFPTHMAILWSWDDANASYADVASAIIQCPFGKFAFEHIVPHDMGARQQSDKQYKHILFEETLHKYGIKGSVRVLLRPKDPKGDLDIVRGVIGQTLFNSLNAESVITALRNHCRKFNKINGIFEDVPSKTKYRDLADAYRHAAVDFGTREYLNHRANIQMVTKPVQEGVVDIGGVEHLFQGSIMFNSNGSFKQGQDDMNYGNVPTHLTY